MKSIPPMTPRLSWFCYLFPALTMSLGWGLRGFIGGGPLGAMIPGAMVGLALCALLGHERDAGFVAACAAVGVGFGGQETYGQTVGLSFQPETFWWAMLGFAIKGGVWGMLGGAWIAIGLTRREVSARRILLALAAMVAGTWGGWKLLNEPKFVYFSNRLDHPRPEIWAGLLLGTVLLLFALRSRLALAFSMWGSLGGAIGFALGAAVQALGRPLITRPWLDWWKGMELVFGACLGFVYGWCAWRCRDRLDGPAGVSAPAPLLRALASAAVAIGIAITLTDRIPSRFDYTITGALLIAACLFSEVFAWQTAITVTYCAFALDLLKDQPTLPQLPRWIFVIATTIAVALFTARRPRVSTMFALLTATAVGMSVLKVALSARPAPIVMEVVFVLMGAGAIALLRFLRTARRAA